MKEINSRLNDWKDLPHVILATGRYLGEGFDDSRPDTLYSCPAGFMEGDHLSITH